MSRPARRAAALAAVGLAAGAAIVTGLSALLARTLITPPRHRDDVEIVSIGPEGIRLVRTPDTELPGRYALWIGDRLVRIGEIVDEDETTVLREITGKGRVRIGGRASARFSGYHLYRPRDLELPFRSVIVDTELGPAPAWIIGDESATTWCIQVHGRGVNRREPLRAVPILAERGIPSMCVAYRNDGEAPRTADGTYRLGLDEWRDVDAAIDVAVAAGAERILLMGWSMGGQVVLQLARRSRHRRRIVGILLDSPVVSWGPTLLFHTRLARVPVAFVHTATALLESPAARLAGGEALDFGALDGIAYADSYAVPILLQHSADDGFVPPDASRAFAEARPEIVEYHEWHGAKHCKLWNLDEPRYREIVHGWLDRTGLSARS